ncbi:MAG: class I SAM-dependent methyltransferase, partial [Gammaproteobacteria bacterium]|nr:class I SAM-dependent methyltransferase [Gammaproteobacteria bacterium]
SSIHNIDFKNEKFDVITLWHVLEHIDDPVYLFNKLYNLLSDNGILVVQVPNSDSLGFKLGKQYWFHLDTPRHLIIYNKNSFNILCEKTGFSVSQIKNEFYDYPQDLLWSLMKSNWKYPIIPIYPVMRILSAEHLTFICKKLK